MSEESERVGSGPEGNGAGIDPTAVALALAGASREDAREFLAKQGALIEDQRRLVELQAKELAHELKLRHWSLWVRHASGLLRLALELSAGLLLLFAVTAIGVVVWNAAHADGLVIESFSVPPDMAARGLTGQVVASQMLDQLTAMQNVTASVRPGKSYANNWGDDIKVEIPDTGMSVGEAYRFLRGWLGHETYISGEVTRTKTGVAITARSGADPGATVTGTEDDFGDLVHKMAEQIYGVTQPYRYAIYLATYTGDLGRPQRVAEGVAILRKLTESPDPLDRAWAWNGLSVQFRQTLSDLNAAKKAAQNALAAYPGLSAGYTNLIDSEIRLGHAEVALSLQQLMIKRLSNSTVSDLTNEAALRFRLIHVQGRAMSLGDYGNAVSAGYDGFNVVEGGARNRQTLIDNIPISLARQHNGAARSAFGQLPAPLLPLDRGPRASARLLTEAALENWKTVIALEQSVEQTWVHFNQGWDTKTIFAIQLRPWLALAKAKLGDYAGAQSLVAATPGDCYDCVRIRGKIASEAKEWGRADYWFTRAVHDAPSIPFTQEDWGRSLLARGKPDDAITQFTLSNQKGPRFADPLEGWGEALMAKNQSHLALAKFAEAEKYAPNWGRLHLKWGEALAYAGKKDEAKAQFARAAQLYLTSPDRSELAKVNDHG